MSETESVTADRIADLLLHRRIDDTLESHHGDRFNLWLYGNYSKLYLRRTMRILSDRRVASLDVATIAVVEHMRSRGVFTSLLDFLEQKQFAIYVECIQEPRLFAFLERRGYERSDQSMYRLVP